MISRRKFLKLATATGFGFAFVAGSMASEENSSEEEVTVGSMPCTNLRLIKVGDDDNPATAGDIDEVASFFSKHPSWKDYELHALSRQINKSISVSSVPFNIPSLTAEQRNNLKTCISI
jgi:hypothetical protein